MSTLPVDASLRVLRPAFARWLEEQMGRPVCYEKVESGDEQILPPREQRELGAVPSPLALRADEGLAD